MQNHPAVEFLNTLFNPEDQIRIFTKLPLPPGQNSPLSERVSAEEASTGKYIERLLKENATRQVYVSMATFMPDAVDHTKKSIDAVKCVYADFDADGPTALALLESCVSAGEIPPPTFVNQTSPEKFHVIWRVNDATVETAEALNRRLALKFGGDPAAVPASQVLRIPSFRNLKADYPNYVVTTIRRSPGVYSLADFKIPVLPVTKSNAPKRLEYSAERQEWKKEQARCARLFTNESLRAMLKAGKVRIRGTVRGKIGIHSPWEEEGHEGNIDSCVVFIGDSGYPVFSDVRNPEMNWNGFTERLRSEGMVFSFNKWADEQDDKAVTTTAMQTTTSSTQPAPTPSIEKSQPRYPVEVWDGTEYAEFASLCSLGNFVPKEFYLEAFKTMTGAVLGTGLSCSTDGITPRFYTVLLTAAQGGKGTSFRRAKEFYSSSPSTDDPSCLLWHAGVSPRYENVGAADVRAGSAAGMQKILPQPVKLGDKEIHVGQSRWVQIWEEFNAFQSAISVPGSGASLLAANRELYDSTEFSTTTTKDRACHGTFVLNSIMLATTIDLWQDMFCGVGAQGSGLFGRFSMVSNDAPIPKVSLKTPKWESLRTRMFERIARLESHPQVLHMTQEAEYLLFNWINGPKFEGHSDDVIGRLNLIAGRNALHLAWLHNKAVIDAEEMRGGIALGDYQFEVRLLNQPNIGNNVIAQTQAKIRNVLRRYGKLQRRELFKKIHSERIGTVVATQALTALVQNGDVKKDVDGFYSVVD